MAREPPASSWKPRQTRGAWLQTCKCNLNWFSCPSTVPGQEFYITEPNIKYFSMLSRLTTRHHSSGLQTSSATMHGCSAWCSDGSRTTQRASKELLNERGVARINDGHWRCVLPEHCLVPLKLTLRQVLRKEEFSAGSCVLHKVLCNHAPARQHCYNRDCTRGYQAKRMMLLLRRN